MNPPQGNASRLDESYPPMYDNALGGPSAGGSGGPGNAPHSSGEDWNRDTSPIVPLVYRRRHQPRVEAVARSWSPYIVLWILSCPLIRSRSNRAPQEIGIGHPRICKCGRCNECDVCVTERTNFSAGEGSKTESERENDVLDNIIGGDLQTWSGDLRGNIDDALQNITGEAATQAVVRIVFPSLPY